MKIFVENNTKNTINNILEYYYSNINNDYIPGILSEGNLFDDQNSDLYMKVIVIKKNHKINKTWMIDNLSKDYSDDVFNIISSYNYKYNMIYGINPYLLKDEFVTFVEQKDNDVFSMEYIDESKVERNKILYKDNSNVMVYFPLIKDYSSLDKYSNYDLYVEIEYRIKINDLNPDKIGSYNDDRGNFIDLAYEHDNYAFQNNNSKLYWLRATVKLDTNRLEPKIELNDSNIKVVDLSKGKIRGLNLHNYNDDINAGLVVFSNAAVSEIKKYYYFYDINLIAKSDHVKDCMVDYLNDIIVFWEGEYNSKLPQELKDAISQYNIQDRIRISELISPAMHDSQLLGLWDVFDVFLPNQKLANIMMNDYLNLSKEHKLDFYPPIDINEYSYFVKNILEVLNLNAKSFNLTPEKEDMLYNIIDCNYLFKSSYDLYSNYLGFCNLVLKAIKYEKK